MATAADSMATRALADGQDSVVAPVSVDAQALADALDSAHMKLAAVQQSVMAQRAAASAVAQYTAVAASTEAADAGK